MTEVVQSLTLGSLEANMPESAVVGPHTESLFVDVVDVLDHAGGDKRGLMVTLGHARVRACVKIQDERLEGK